MGGIASLKKRFRPIRMSQASVAAKVKAATFWEAPWLRLVAQAALFAALLATAAVIVSVWYFFITADGYIDYGEGLVLFHQTQAGAGLNVYDPVYRNGPPYSVPAYGPVYYYLVGAILPRQPSLLPGRLISILSLIGISGASWWFLRRRCGSGLLIASMGAVVWLVLLGPFSFGVNNRTDPLAIFFGLSALFAAATFSQAATFSRVAVSWAGWQAAIPLLLLAGFTKPTAAVAPAVAIFLTHAMDKRWKEAICLALTVSLAGAGILAAGDWLSAGNFSQCLIFSNANAMSADAMLAITRGCCQQVLLPVGILLGGLLLRDPICRIFGLHAMASFVIATLTSANVGANVNYFMEASWAAGFCLALVLQKLHKEPVRSVSFALSAALVLQAAVHFTPNLVFFHSQMDAWPILVDRLRTYGACGPVLTRESGAQILIGQKPYLADPHTIKRLSDSGKMDISLMLQSLRRQEFVAVIAEDDMRLGHRPLNWTNEVRNLVATHYQPREKFGLFTLYVPRSKPLETPPAATAW